MCGKILVSFVFFIWFIIWGLQKKQFVIELYLPNENMTEFVLFVMA